MILDQLEVIEQLCSEMSDYDEIIDELIWLNCMKNERKTGEKFIEAFFELCCDDLEEKLGKLTYH